LILWDLETGQELRRCTGGHRDAVIDVAFSPDGKTVLASSGASTDSFTLQFWSADQGGLWSDYGEDEFDLVLWDVESCEIVHRFDTDDHDNFSLAISPGGEWALAGSTDQQIYRWDLRSGELLGKLEGHRSPVTTIALSQDGRQALSGEAYGHGLILWDLDSGEPLAFLNAHGYEMWTLADIDLDISPDGRRALSTSTDGALVLWDLADWRETRRLEGHADPVTDLAFTPDGLQLVSSSGRFDPGMSVSKENNIRLWELESGEQVGVLTGHTDGVTSIALSPDGARLLSSSIDESVRLWDLDTGREIDHLSGHGSWVTDVAFGPAGRTALSGSVLGTLLLWELETGMFTRSFPSPGGVFALAIGPDGRTALSAGGGESPVYVWDLDKGYDIGRFWEHVGPDLRVGALALSPDGRLALSGDSTGTLILWEIDSGEVLHHLSGHSEAIAAVSVSADGRQAFTCDEGGTSILWDLESGALLGRFSATGTGRTGACALSPDGRLGATGVGNDIILWQLGVPTLDELLNWIEANRYVRQLTGEERALYQIEEGP
jgi:WD40 repeat protein